MHLRIHFIVMSRFRFGLTKSLWHLVWAPSFPTFIVSMEEQLQLQVSVLERNLKAKFCFLVQK